MFTDLQSPGKPRTITKSNTVSVASKPLTSGGSVGRRSTISYEAKAASNEKTNLSLDPPRYVKFILHKNIACNSHSFNIKHFDHQIIKNILLIILFDDRTSLNNQISKFAPIHISFLFVIYYISNLN